jgi:hypothetical protein
MEAVQLFININRPGINDEWNKSISTSLKALPGVEQLLVIEENEHSYAQISMSYKVQELSINEIENTITCTGAYITDINIHFPSDITGIADPYSASAASITIGEKLKQIDGVLGGAISSKGELKVTLDTTTNNKHNVIENIINTICDRTIK